MSPVQVQSNQHQEEAVPLTRQTNQRTGNSENTDGTSWREVWRCPSNNTVEVPKESVCPDGSLAYKTHTCAFETTAQSVNGVCETRNYVGHMFFACVCYPTIFYLAKT